MDARIGSQLGMEGGHHVPAFFDPHRMVPVDCKGAYPFPCLYNDGSADEDRLHLTLRCSYSGHAAVELAPVRVPFDDNIHQLQAALRWMRNFAGHQDGSGASP